MPLMSGTIPSMIGGVSQQDASVRLPSQLEEALNCDLSPSKGAGPRPPAQFAALLGSDIPLDAFWHSITRDAREHYLVCAYSDKVRVFDQFTGKEYVVVMDAPSREYLKTLYGPDVSLRAVTIADYTMIVNREVVTALASTNSADSLLGSVQTFTDLPKTTTVGSIWEVRGDDSNSFDNYYVQSESSKVWREVSKPGIKGSLDPATMPHGIKRVPDGTNPDGFYFSYGPLSYDSRLAGDTDSAPPPSFIGQRIGNVAFHKDRFVIVAGPNVVLSEIGYYFNFWRTTVTSLLDSDPIDMAAPSSGVAEITHAVSYQKALLLFASGNVSMFQMTGTPTLTPHTAKMDVVTTYSVSPYVSPMLAGSSMFFVDDSSQKKWATVREYFVQDDQVTPEAANVTAHVPAYVPGNTRCMASAPDADMLFVAHRSPTGPQVFVHQYKWAGDEKQQSAWHPWEFSGTGAILHMHAVGTDLYVVAAAPGGGAEMLKVGLGTSPTYPLISDEFDIYLDRHEAVTPVWQAFGNYTDITVPFILPTLKNLAVLKTTEWDAPGTYLDTRTATLVNGGQTLRLQGRFDTGKVVIGYRYNRRVTLSEQFVRDRNGVSQLIGRLQIKRMTVRFNDAAYFRCLVFPKGRDVAIDTLVPKLTHTFAGRTAGDASFLTDTPVIQTGTYSFLVASRSDQVNVAFDCDTPFPAWFQSVNWEALYTIKVRQ